MCENPLRNSSAKLWQAVHSLWVTFLQHAERKVWGQAAWSPSVFCDWHRFRRTSENQDCPTDSNWTAPRLAILHLSWPSEALPVNCSHTFMFGQVCSEMAFLHEQEMMNSLRDGNQSAHDVVKQEKWRESIRHGHCNTIACTLSIRGRCLYVRHSDQVFLILSDGTFR